MIISNQIQEIDEEREMNRKKRRSEERERERERERKSFTRLETRWWRAETEKKRKKENAGHSTRLTCLSIK